MPSQIICALTPTYFPGYLLCLLLPSTPANQVPLLSSDTPWSSPANLSLPPQLVTRSFGLIKIHIIQAPCYLSSLSQSVLYTIMTSFIQSLFLKPLGRAESRKGLSMSKHLEVKLGI